MSLLYEIAKPVLRRSMKKRMEEGIENPYPFVYKIEKIQNNALPLKKLHRKYSFEEKKVYDVPYFIMQPPEKNPDGILLYFFGGGYCKPGKSSDFAFASDIAKNTGKEVWMVWYPLFPNATAYEIACAAADAYEEALKKMPAQQIVFYGNSSGASLCFTACVFLRKYRPNVPLPYAIVAHSPLMRYPTEEEQKRMEELDQRDVIIPAHLMDMYRNHTDLFRYGGFYEFMNPIDQDWKDFPKMLVLFGEDEVFSAFLESIILKAEKDDVSLETYVGKGCHCFSAVSFLPEAKEGRKIIYDFLRKR